MPYKNVYIVGTGRSGTTIMKKSLGRHTYVQTIDHEAQLITDPADKIGLWQILTNINTVDTERVKKLENYLISRYKFTRTEGGKNKVYHFDWIKKEEYVKLVDDLLNKYCLEPSKATAFVSEFLHLLYSPLLEKNNKKIIIDDSPNNGHFIPEILATQENSVIIHMMREGLGVAHSMVKKGWAFRFETAAQRWSQNVQTIRSLGSAYGGDKYIEIYLSELVNNPVDNMKKILNTIGVPFEKSCITVFSFDKANTYKYNITEYERNYVDALYKY